MLLPLLLNNLLAATPVVVDPGVTTGSSPGKRTPRLAPWAVPLPQPDMRPAAAQRRRRRDEDLVLLFKP